jgi:hypothetical protein
MINSSIPSQTGIIRRIILLCFLSALCFIQLHGQSKVEMTKPQLILVNDTLIIRYGFIGSKPWDIYKVKLEITDSTGKAIPARSFSGDIGDSIYGGQQKIILWNMAADNIFISENIYVEVVSEKVKTIAELFLKSPPADSLHAKKAESGTGKKDDGSVMANKMETNITEVPYKKNNFLLSAIVPGWGLTRLSNGKPYWLIGFAGFGCIATSIYFNHKAVSSYDSYKESIDVNVYPDYFKRSEQQYLISNMCAYSAIAIWVIDLGVVAFRAQKVSRSIPGQNLTRVSIGSGYQGSTITAFVSLNYRF